MADRIAAVLDHVAVAVADGDTAERRWREQLGGSRVAWAADEVFASRQLRYANGAKIELLSPSPADASGDNFVRRFLTRFGSAVHHVTLKVGDLQQALGVLGDAGLDVVDVSHDSEAWHEAFLRPSQVGRLVVQVAWSGQSDEEWARQLGHIPSPPAPGAAALLGPRLRHPDVQRARWLWTLLGADVSAADGGLRCTWPDSALDIRIEHGEPAGPVAVRMRGTPDLPAVDGLGPSVEGDR